MAMQEPRALGFGRAARDYAHRQYGECRRKHRYRDQASAERAVVFWRTQGDYSIHAYACPHGCRGWHIGH